MLTHVPLPPNSYLHPVLHVHRMRVLAGVDELRHTGVQVGVHSHVAAYALVHDGSHSVGRRQHELTLHGRTHTCQILHTELCAVLQILDPTSHTSAAHQIMHC